MILLVLLSSNSLWARPITAYEAENVVIGWLKRDSQPLGVPLNKQVTKVDTFVNDIGETVYYIVYLQSSGFVIVSANDLIEPIIGFSDDGTFNPSYENPLGALVNSDLKNRNEQLNQEINNLSEELESILDQLEETQITPELDNDFRSFTQRFNTVQRQSLDIQRDLNNAAIESQNIQQKLIKKGENP